MTNHQSPSFMIKYWRETLAVAQRILIELLRRRFSLILWCVFPITILVINGLLIAERTKLSMSDAFENVAPSALIGSALFFSCLGGTVATVVAEREQQTLKRLFLSPLSGLSYFLGIFIAHSFIGIGQTLIIYTVAAFWGAKFQGSLVLGGIIILLSVISYVGLGFILSTHFARRTHDVNSIVASFGVPLLMMGGAFFPTSFFPDSLLKIAKFNPIYHMNEALIAVSDRGEGLAKIESHFWFLCVFAVLVAGCGWLSYRSMVQIERRL